MSLPDAIGPPSEQAGDRITLVIWHCPPPRSEEFEDEGEGEFEDTTHPLTLAIPVAVLKTLSRKPFKWMRFAAYAILSLDGEIFTKEGAPVNEDTAQVDGGSFVFQPSGDSKCSIV